MEVRGVGERGEDVESELGVGTGRIPGFILLNILRR